MLNAAQEAEFTCPNCNADIYEGQKVCPGCGLKVDWSEEKKEVTQIKRVNVNQKAPTAEWYYSLCGQRVGPVSRGAIATLVRTGRITPQTSVWRMGMQNWSEASRTELGSLFAASDIEPPPLPVEAVNNTFVWLMALLPLVASLIKAQIPGSYADPNSIYIFLLFIGNTALYLADNNALNKAGYKDNALAILGLVLVPLYLFVRASKLKQPPYYGFVWLITFVLSLVL